MKNKPKGKKSETTIKTTRTFTRREKKNKKKMKKKRKIIDRVLRYPHGQFIFFLARDLERDSYIMI